MMLVAGSKRVLLRRLPLVLMLLWCVTKAMAGDIELQDCVVRFADEVEVPALETGRVAEVPVKLNDVVEKGDALARLDDRGVLILRRAALLRVDSARSDAIDAIELRYAETALAEAQAELDTSRSIQRDVSGAIPLSQLRRLRLAVERGGLEVARTQKRQKQARVELELRETDVSVLDEQLRNLHCESPIDGIVLEVARSAGEWIEKGQPIVTVAQIDRLHVHALASSKQVAPAACRGLPVSVHWNDAATGAQQSLRGKVLSVDPQMLPGGRFRLHAEIINETDESDPHQWKLTPGTEIRMKMYVSVASRSQRVPAQR
jgi:multidrug efflux pump subunit AcrA (membrane-fusion protein)